MLLRGLFFVLLLLNGAYFAWSQGLLQAYGLGPADHSEPQRLEQQIRPEALRLLGSDEVRRIDAQQAAAAAAGKTCLQAGLFDEAQASALSKVLDAALPGDSWQLEPTLQPARWIVYMGKYDNADALVKKRGELRYLNVPSEPVRNPVLEPGLSLGAFETQAAATNALNLLSQRGVRTARVVQERAEVRGVQLRVPQADESMRTQLEGLKPLLAGKVLQTCPN